ncbi:MAG: PIG-L family deacetylase [Clostridia bacterium]|jgi:LmbE family N-acetylglucosaminyl deacetylase|nr:PIG-L family deacetylase [Clostridia bacterium]
MKRICLSFAILLAVMCLFVSNSEEAESKNLTSMCDIKVSGGQSVDVIVDGSQYGSEWYQSGTVFEIECEEEIAGIYIIWDKKAPIWTMESDGNTYTYGEKEFLHEFVEVENTKKLKITLSESARICEIYVFGEGILPNWVQVWEESHDKADLLLLSTHADDEHLFFAGVLPYYAVERGLKVQVVYMTNHNDTQSRPHELLNGLWVVGIRHYPVISDFPDLAGSLGQKGEDVETVLKRALILYDEEEVTRFHVENIRRFKPKVIVGHDINGEYKHGAHMVNAFTLMKALELSNDPEYHKETYDKYGLWDVPKTYLHLWEENRIVMDWDVPLSKFGGLTAYEVSKLGYNEHKSQHGTWFTKWFMGVYNGKERNKASDIAEYSPCEYGLYRSTVGEDVLKNDFFENVEPHVDETPVPTTPEPTVTPTPKVTETSTPEKTDKPTNTPENGGDNNIGKKVLYAAVIVVVLIMVVFVLKIIVKRI